jgi:hypothetical protein
MSTQANREQPAAEGDSRLWLAPLLYVVLVAIYFVGRYGGRWAENDSAVFTEIIRAFGLEGRLVPIKGDFYPNGYTYQAVSAFLCAITGLQAATLQQIVYPFVASLVVLPAWAVYRELTESARGALITTVLLFTQPEFLFVLLRSSHEKFTRLLLLLCLYCLVRGFKLRDRPGILAAYIGLFYAFAYAMIASNNLLAHSFVLMIAVTGALGWLLGYRSLHLRQHAAPLLRRLTYVTLGSLLLVYVVLFYIYPPALHDLLVLRETSEKVSALVLDVEDQSTNAYSQVAVGWVNLPVYFVLTLANWIILVGSFVLWTHQAWRLLYRREAPESRTSWLLWLLYTAFALQGGLSVLADASGSLGGNLQHRLFPSFTMIAVAVVGRSLARWQPRRYIRRVELALAIGVGCIAILSVLKATNEPLVSNKWTFYSGEEVALLDWSDAHLRTSEIWTEFDERLSSAALTVRGKSLNQNTFVAFRLPATTRSLMVSSITRLRAARLGNPLPVPPDALLVYDNGGAQLYHVRPQTPYQR